MEQVLDISGGVCDPRHKNGNTEHRAFFVLNSVTVPPQHMENFGRTLEMMQCQERKPFRWHKMFSEGRTLVEDEHPSGRISATSGVPWNF
jgi:hypothetical protein